MFYFLSDFSAKPFRSTIIIHFAKRIRKLMRLSFFFFFCLIPQHCSILKSDWSEDGNSFSIKAWIIYSKALILLPRKRKRHINLFKKTSAIVDMVKISEILVGFYGRSLQF